MAAAVEAGGVVVVEAVEVAGAEVAGVVEAAVADLTGTKVGGVAGVDLTGTRVAGAGVELRVASVEVAAGARVEVVVAGEVVAGVAVAVVGVVGVAAGATLPSTSSGTPAVRQLEQLEVILPLQHFAPLRPAHHPSVLHPEVALFVAQSGCALPCGQAYRMPPVRGQDRVHLVRLSTEWLACAHTTESPAL